MSRFPAQNEFSFWNGYCSRQLSTEICTETMRSRQGKQSFFWKNQLTRTKKKKREKKKKKFCRGFKRKLLIGVGFRKAEPGEGVEFSRKTDVRSDSLQPTGESLPKYFLAYGVVYETPFFFLTRNKTRRKEGGRQKKTPSPTRSHICTHLIFSVEEIICYISPQTDNPLLLKDEVSINVCLEQM